MDGDEISLFILGNFADYIFMISYGCLLFSSSLLVTRSMEEGSIGQKTGFIVSILGVIAAVSDGIENVFIILMASDPLGFPGWLAIPHSLFAHIKFKLMYLSFLWIALALVVVVIGKVVKQKQLTVLKACAHSV